MATLSIGMVVRLVVSFLAVFKSGLNFKEMLFIPFAWFPKATVQVRRYLHSAFTMLLINVKIISYTFNDRKC